MKNKAEQIRNLLSTSKTECGKLFTDNTGKSAYDIWARWERTGQWSSSTDKLFSIILYLKMAREFKTKTDILTLVIDLLKNK